MNKIKQMLLRILLLFNIKYKINKLLFAIDINNTIYDNIIKGW